MEVGKWKMKMEVGKWKMETRSGMAPLGHGNIYLNSTKSSKFPCYYQHKTSPVLLYLVCEWKSKENHASLQYAQYKRTKYYIHHNNVMGLEVRICWFTQPTEGEGGEGKGGEGEEGEILFQYYFGLIYNK